MKNSINYYYDIYIDEIHKTRDYYYFYLNNHEYHLKVYDRPEEEINYLFSLNEEMIKRNILVHKIIKNINNSPVTLIDGKFFVLLELCDYKNDKVLLNDLKYYNNFTSNLNNKNLFRNDWIYLWSSKIDYYEYQISELGRKYKLLTDSLSYYIGLSENAISYLNNNNVSNNSFIVSHKRININGGSNDFYNPLNFIVDNKIRDISEYIKESFFNNDLNIYEVKEYLDSIIIDKSEYILLFSRLLFPSYYFDIYDEIINNNLPEETIISIIEKNNAYEAFLRNIYKYIRYEKNTFIEPIEWLIR